MEPFDINLAGEILSVLPQPDGSFTVFKGTEHVAVLRPDISKKMGTRWHPCDGLDDQLAQQIGELIEEHEM